MMTRDEGSPEVTEQEKQILQFLLRYAGAGCGFDDLPCPGNVLVGDLWWACRRLQVIGFIHMWRPDWGRRPLRVAIREAARKVLCHKLLTIEEADA